MSGSTHKYAQYALRLTEVPEQRIQECLDLLNHLENTSSRKLRLTYADNMRWTVRDVGDPRNVIHLQFLDATLNYHLHVSADVKQFYTEVGLDQLKQIIAANQLRYIVTQ